MALVAAGCAETSTGAVRARGPRTGPDDGDLWNLVPNDTDALADVDLAALRSSAWSRSLMEGGFEGEREERRRRFGFDVFTEAERMLVASTETTGTPATLTIARGRFDTERVGGAFVAATSGAIASQWRQSPLWEGQGRAVALVTPRTLAQGDGPRVRAAVDAAWGMSPDAGAGPLGELRRTLNADKSPPAVTLAITVTDGMRARSQGVLVVPDGLRRVGARLDLGEDLDADALALFDGGDQAARAATLWADAARVYAGQRMLALLGLAPLFDGLTVAAEGSRVHVHLHVAADKRENLAEKILGMLQWLAKRR
ncbi:MAG TPA: hypothetical protein VIF57_24895, partial [Polyangia bacterium]